MSKIKYNRIKILLAEHDVSNRELAEHLGVNENTVSRWCTNTIQPTVEGLYQIANYLDVDVRELLVPNKK